MNKSTTNAGAPRALIVLIAVACGLNVANIYYAQPLIGPIAQTLHLSAAAAGLIVTMAQVGYGLGLLFLVPLSDLFENRRLMIVLLACAAAALAAAAASTDARPFLIAALLIGATSVGAQVMVAYAAHLATDETRGRVVGSVMSGLMLGIMLARPLASFVAQFTSWHFVFVGSSIGMVLLAIALRMMLPVRRPQQAMPYGALLSSMQHLARTTPVLQQRGLYHALLFGTFSLFWTTTPLLLTHAFGLSQGAIAVFALAGVAGAVAAPVAGRLADRGLTVPASITAMLACSAAFGLSLIVHAPAPIALGLLVIAAIMLDAGVTMHLVISQRLIFAVGAAVRGRLNGLFIAIVFLGGAIGSGIGVWVYTRGGWEPTALIGCALPLVALGFYALSLLRVERVREPERTSS